MINASPITFSSSGDIVGNNNMIESIFNIEQDMWARKEGIGEYVFCSDCDTIYSKQDIYNRKDFPIYGKTVSEIETLLGGLPDCPNCKGKTNHCYEKELYIPHIIDRYSQKVFSTLVFQNTELIGFIDGYAADFSTIFDMEFQDHYGSIGERSLQTHLEHTCGKVLDGELFTCASAGTKEDYMSIGFLYQALGFFFNSIPEESLLLTGVTELKVDGSLAKILSLLGAQRAYLRQQEDFYEKIPRKGTYIGDIYVQEQSGFSYRNSFQMPLRELLKKFRKTIET